MGCDIHAHIEVRKDNKWYHFAAPHVKRDYNLFYMINGVRPNMAHTQRTPVAHKLVCLPEDASEVTKICHEQDATNYPIHSLCMLLQHDIRQLQKNLEDDFRNGLYDYIDLEMDVFKTYINSEAIDEAKGWDESRIICWFDN